MNHTEALSKIVGAANLVHDEKRLVSGSKDSFHFSPVLLRELDGKKADYIALPETQEQLGELISYASKHRIPITPRGAGTGNYGQGVPLHGGIMINTRKMNRVIELNRDFARVEAGTVLWQIEKQAEAVNAELRIFPSTMPTSSSAGFVTGGSGGVGSIDWGMLSDNDNVRALKILTIEDQPRAIELRGMTEIKDALHNCGLTAFVTEVEFALAPKTHWYQYAYAFDNFYEAALAGELFAGQKNIKKRLCTVLEWPIPSYFLPLVKKGGSPDGKAQLLLQTDQKPDFMNTLFTDFDGAKLMFHAEPAPYSQGRGFQLYDFTWNHTTMWAMKADKELTYLQDAFDASSYLEQIKKRKQKYGDDVATHIEFIGAEDGVRPGGLSIVRYRGKEALYELIDYCESIDIRVSNPHTHFLDADIRWYQDYLVDAKKRWDPMSLLNPGHLKRLEPS